MQMTGIRKVLAGLSVLVLCAGGARATDYTWYVDLAATGDESGTNWVNACTNIQAAFDAAETWLDANTANDTRDDLNPGDAIYIIVRAGTYSERLIPGSDGTYDNGIAGSDSAPPLYIQSEFWETTGKWGTVISGAATSGDIFYMRNYGPPAQNGFGNWYVRGFTIRSDFATVTVNQAGIVDSAGSGTIENNVIEAVNTTDSYVWKGIASANDLVIRDNIIRKLGPDGNSPYCLAALGSDNEVHNNLLVMDGTSVDTYDATLDIHQNAANNQIHHNIIMGYPSVEAVLAMPAPHIASNTKTNEIYANIIANAGRLVDGGTTPPNTAESTVFYNNTFYSGEYIHCYSDPDTFFNNLIVTNGAINFSWPNGIYFDGVDHPSPGYDDYNDGTNYYRAADTIFETTTLPSGWTNMLPDELSESGWLRPIKGTTYPGISSLDGYNAAATDVYGVSYLDGPQIGAVSPPHPKGTVVSVR